MSYRYRLLVIVLLWTTLEGVLWGQENVAIGSSASALLARLERLQRHEDVCILVNRSGQYRLERVFAAKSEVFTGELSQSDLGMLEQSLDSDELRTLSQRRIPSVLITDTEDSFTITVFRPEGVQNLLFASSESRKAFRKTVDPVVKWLDRVQKDRHTRLADNAASRCLPPKVNPPASPSRDRSVSSSAGHGSRGLDYLVEMTIDHSVGRGVARTCVVVGSSGRYRMEKTTQTDNSSPEVHVFEDSVSPAELQNLRNLLDDPELVNLPQADPQSIPPSLEIGVTRFMIPRSETVPHLLLTSYFNVRARMPDPGGMGNMHYGVEQGAKAVQPLRDWMKDNIEKKKLTPLDNAQPNGCSLSP